MPADPPTAPDPAAMPTRVNGPAGPFEAALAVPAGLTVLSLRMEAGVGGDAFARWAVDDCAALLAALQVLLREGASPNIAILIVLDDTADPWERAAMDATLEAVRGAVHSLTPEIGAATRLNVIACRPGHAGGIAPALEYVASPGGAYVAGSTFDLRETA